MKTIEKILREKVASRRKTIKLFGNEFDIGPDTAPVRARLEQDPALSWISTAVAEAMIEISCGSYASGTPISPFKMAEGLKVAFAQMIMLWEEVNEDYNAQLQPPTPKT